METRVWLSNLDASRVLRFAIAVAARSAIAAVDVQLVRSEDVLRRVAPKVMAAGLVWMIAIAIACDKHRFATQMHARRMDYR